MSRAASSQRKRGRADVARRRAGAARAPSSSSARSICRASAAASRGGRVERGVAGDLDERVGRRGDDRRAAGHGLEHGQAEALRERRIDEDLGGAVELARRLARGVARDVDLVAVRRARDPAVEARRSSSRRRRRARGPAASGARPQSRSQATTSASTFLRGSSVPRYRMKGRALEYRWRVRCRAAGSSAGQKNARSTPLRATRTRVAVSG